jgi:glycine/D-amino acid oxidase-like deaminating enzyme
MSRDIVIIGGGAIGSSVASFLVADPAFAGTVTVVERDPTYARASSALSASSIRQQFSTPINIELSRFGIEFLRDIGQRLNVDGERPDVSLVENGYLFLASPQGERTLRSNHALQRGHGVDVDLMEPAALARRFPWLATSDLACGAFGVQGEGWFDGYSLLQAFRRHARSRGARYVHAEASGFDVDGSRIVAARLANGDRIVGDAFVNAAGPWAAEVAGWLGIDLPVRARRRCVFGFRCPTPIPACPLVIDPTGVWFRPEGRNQFICGVSPPEADDPDGLPLDVDHALFDDLLWPTLAHRVPAFEALRPLEAWAGYYEVNTFDQNGIVGPHPDWPSLWLANGFSGHGLQQAPAVGRALAEHLVHGRYRTIDASPLGFGRIVRGEPLLERNVV